MTSTSSKGRGLSSLVDKLQNYISSYTSSTASWLTYPYFGISAGVTSIIVIFVVIYILILGQLQHYHSFYIIKSHDCEDESLTEFWLHHILRLL
jgi:hypothetical protein